MLLVWLSRLLGLDLLRTVFAYFLAMVLLSVLAMAIGAGLGSL